MTMSIPLRKYILRCIALVLTLTTIFYLRKSVYSSGHISSYLQYNKIFKNRIDHLFALKTKNSTKRSHVISPHILSSQDAKDILNSVPNSKLIANGSDLLFLDRNNIPRFSPVYHSYLKPDVPFMAKCGTCAVVSNSGRLLGSSAGEDIDSHDCVIRHNDARVTNFTEDVGCRTDFRFIGHAGPIEKWDALFKEEDEKSIGSHILISGQDSVIFKVAQFHHEKSPNISFYTWHRNGTDLEKYWGSVWCNGTRESNCQGCGDNTMISTGLTSVVTALHVCDSITLYGMIPSDYCLSHPPVKYHYYQKESTPTDCGNFKIWEKQKRTNKSHKMLQEHSVIFRTWAEYRNISYRVPTYDP